MLKLGHSTLPPTTQEMKEAIENTVSKKALAEDNMDLKPILQ